MSNKLVKTFCAAWLGLAFTACGTTEQQQVDVDDVMTLAVKDGTDIQQALSAIPGAMVVGTHEDGVPFFIKGSFGKATGSAMGLAAADAKSTVEAALSGIAPVFRLRAEDLVFQRATTDEHGYQYLRFSQMKNGLPVVGGGELILHLDKEGNVFAANGDARDAQGMSLAMPRAQIAAEAAAVAALNGTQALTKEAKAERLVYVRVASGQLVLAHEVRVVGVAVDSLPVEDMVYVNANTGAVELRAPRIHTALNRAVYSANNGTSLPGTLKRSEGGAATNDAHVDENYVHLGTTYDCYKTNFARDSYNAAGAQLKSTVHYSSNYVNAFWNGTQMVYGDGNNVDSGPLGKDLDVTVHELTHAVTDNESDLVYSNESGALNEGMSDIFAAYCESWTRSWSTDADVWKIGEDIWTPGTAGDALRYMANPTQDGSSKDYYPERYTGTQDNGGVHWNSGIANLAFKLLSTGGTHPRNKTTINVTGIGVLKAGKIFYEANANCMTSSTNFAGAKTCTEQKADQFYAADKASVTAAWEAVGVGGSTPPPSVVTLSNGTPVTGLSDSTGGQKHYKLTVASGQSSLKFETSGGSGDVDLYVKFGSQPSTSSYDCRPYKSGNAEVCNFTNPAAGDWYVMLNAYSSYSSVTLTGTYASSTGGGDTLTNGVATAAYSGSKGTWKCWTLTVPSGKSVAFNQAGVSGTSGDADLYVRKGAAPTTSTYDCRPYLSGNNESCSFAASTSNITFYACSYGYSAYTSVTMKGTY